MRITTNTAESAKDAEKLQITTNIAKTAKGAEKTQITTNTAESAKDAERLQVTTNIAETAKHAEKMQITTKIAKKLLSLRSLRSLRLSSFPAFAAFAFSALIVVGASAQQQALTAPTDTAAVERGRQLMAQECGFCHGANARGGSSGPDLTRSPLVMEDENGRQLGEFLRVGRPDRGMPAFDLTAAQMSDLAAFLHGEIYAASNRRLYKILDILVGDPKAGQAYFTGAGRCASCHSPTGDLKGIGAKYDPVVLQGRAVYPRRGGIPGSPAYEDRNAVKATIALPSGGSVTGAIVRLTDFEVTIYDAATGQQRSWLRNGDTPKVTVTDPLQAHLDQLTKWTDADMHNVTAYLASLK